MPQHELEVVGELERWIRDGQASLQVELSAVTYLNGWPSYSGPVLLTASDGRDYVVKGLRVGNEAAMAKALTAEQVVATLGRMLRAPIPPVTLIDVPAELIAIEPLMAHFSPGVAHAQLFMPGYSDRMDIVPPKSERNRAAYALLAALYGWAGAGDHQLIASLDRAADVYSVDHGHFFSAGGPTWDAASLGAAHSAEPDPHFVAYAEGSAVEAAVRRVKAIPREGVAAAVSRSHPDWGVSIGDLVALAQYLIARRDDL